jgi:hypothetical protein
MRAQISRRLVQSLKPSAKPFEVRDNALKGFMLRVQPSGARPRSLVVPADRVARREGCMWPFKNTCAALFALAFALAGVPGPLQPIAAQTEDEELPDLEFAEGRVKIRDIVRLYYVSPVLATIRHEGASDPKLIALVDRLRLTVSNTATFYPGAWAETGPAGFAPVSIDAAYFWTKKEQSWLAALQSLNHKTSSSTIESAFTQYRARCRETRHLQQPAPWVSLGTIGENRHFGDINKALAGLPSVDRNAVDNESRRISRQFMAYVLLHEIAHHYLGHLAKNIPLEDARRLELDADEWALRRAASMGYSLADVRVMFRLEARAEAERLAAGYVVPPTHPPWLTRAARLDWLLPQIPVAHQDVVRLIGILPIDTSKGLRYINVELEFPHDPVAAGTMMSSLTIGDRAEALDGVVNHRESGTFLWFREYGIGGPRYVIRIEDALSHEPRAVWQTIGLGQPAPSSISSLSLRPDFARDPVTALVGQRSLRSQKWRVSEALQRSGAPANLQAEAFGAFFASERKLEDAVMAWVMGDLKESDFDAQRDQLTSERWDRQRKILGDALYERFQKAYFELLHD